MIITKENLIAVLNAKIEMIEVHSEDSDDNYSKEIYNLREIAIAIHEGNNLTMAQERLLAQTIMEQL